MFSYLVHHICCFSLPAVSAYSTTSTFRSTPNVISVIIDAYFVLYLGGITDSLTKLLAHINKMGKCGSTTR